MSNHMKSQRDIENADQNADQNKITNAVLFTHLSILYLNSETERKIFWCKGMSGLGIRVSPNGNKTWVFDYRINKKSRRVTIGKFPKVSLSEVTRLYVLAKEKVDFGVDPFKDKDNKREKIESEPTVYDLIEIYLEHCKNSGKKTYKAEERAFDKDLPHEVKVLKISQVPPRKISEAINAVFSRGSPSSAQHLFKYTRRMFNFAADVALVERSKNPCLNIRFHFPKKKRQRHLSPKEIYLFWHNIEKLPITEVKRLALKFLLCTVARSIEVREMQWSHVDFNARIWTLPTTKNGSLHRIYLGDLAIEVLNKVKKYTGEYDLVFGSKGYYKNWISKNKKIDKLQPFMATSFSQSIRIHFDKFEIRERFYPHDFRRTGATLIAGLFGRRDYAAMALNHTTSDVTGIYDQYAYDREKKVTLNALNRAIELIVNSSSAESVPSFEELRIRVLQPAKYSIFQQQKELDNGLGLQANTSNRVSDKLFYDHVVSKTLN